MTPSQSFPTIPVFCTAGNKVALDTTTLAIGYQPQQQLPCEYYNQIENQETTALNTIVSGLNNITSELDLVVTSGGGTPSIAQTNQLITALNILYQAHSNGANWSTALASALGANWSTALAVALGAGSTTLLASGINTSWVPALVTALGANWTTALAVALGTNQTTFLANNTKGSAIVSSPAGTLPSNYSDYFLVCNTGCTSCTLPVAAQVGSTVTVKTLVTQTVTINGTIGSLGSTSFLLYNQDDYVMFMWDGTRWNVIATNGPIIVSNQSGQINCTVATAWTAISNGLSLGTIPIGVYDFELDLSASVIAISTLIIAIANGTTPIASVTTLSRNDATYTSGCLHSYVRGYINTAPSTIQGIYYSQGTSAYIIYVSAQGSGKITARRIG